MKPIRTKPSQSLAGDKVLSGKGDQKTNTGRSNLLAYFPKSQNVLRKGSSLDEQTSPRRKDTLTMRSNVAKTKRRHSVDIVTVRCGEVTTTGTKRSHSKLTPPKPETKLKSVIIPKQISPKKVTGTSTLKSTGSFTKTGTRNGSSMNSMEVSDNKRDSKSVKNTGIFTKKGTRLSSSMTNLEINDSKPDPKPILKSTGSFTKKGSVISSSMTNLEVSDCKPDPKSILKSTGSFTEKGTADNSRSTTYLQICDPLDSRFRYRLPEKRQGALRKTVSFQEEILRNKIKEKSRSRKLSSPVTSSDSSDDMIEMDDLTDGLSNM